MTIKIKGQLVDRASGSPVRGASVEGLIKVRNDAAMFSKTDTDRGGQFNVDLEERQWEQFLAADPEAFVYFRVFMEGRTDPVADTQDTLRWKPGGTSDDIRIEIDNPSSLRHVRGTIWTAEGQPARDVTVQARDNQPGGQGILLGTAKTDAAGTYVIEYSTEILEQVRKQFADIYLQVFADPEAQHLLGPSAVLSSAPPEAVLDLALPPPRSEYEEYLAKLEPLLNGRALHELNDGDIADLSRQAGIPKDRIALLVSSARLGHEAGLDTVIFYALLRLDVAPSLEEILSQPEERIREALDKAYDSGVAPKPDAKLVDAAMQQLKRLRNQRMPLTELAQTIGLDPTLGVFSQLESMNIKTLVDVRSTGGLQFVKGLDISPEDAAIQKLDAHARLITLNPDVATNEALIAKGYSSISAIAQATTEEIAAALGDASGSGGAAALLANAKAQSAFLQNVATGFAANAATGHIQSVEDWGADHPIRQVLPESCGCKDCEAAVSPHAYLADLMQYAIDHLRDSGAKIDLEFFKKNFDQPFSELPANCAAQDEPVRQVRICIEVLRGYLGQRPLTPTSRETTLKQAEQAYLLDTYQRLLTKLGTSFSEIRLARSASLEMRTQIAERIGISAGALTSLFLDPDASPAQLNEAALERLFGLADTTQPPIRQRPVPAIETWRLQHLRGVWKAQDWPSDDYSEMKAPIVDPDLLGPDDFRRPFGKVNINDPDKAFDLWMNRRSWADGLIDNLKSVVLREDTATNTSGPDFQGIVDAMGFPYKGQAPRWQPGALADIRDKLAAMTSENAEATTQELYNNYRLSLDAASRLIELWEKDNVFWVWKNPARAQKLTDDEWEDLYSIILRAQKNELGRLWKQEEVESVLARVQAGELRKTWVLDDDASQILLGRREFWKPLRNSVEGDWPPARLAGTPLIDPEKIKRQDLPDQTAGKRALKFWDDRSDILNGKRKTLKTRIETSTFSDMVTEALGPVPAGATSWADYLRALINDLSATNTATAEAAKRVIENDLHLTVESFQRLVSVMENHVSAGAKPLPSKADWAELFSLLTSAWKEKTLYAGWYAAEIDATNGVEPWRCLRHSLHKWRATAEERQRWDRALERKSKAPIVDPDMLASTAYLKTPGFGDGWSLWDQRRQAIEAKLQSLRVQGAGPNRTATTLNSITDLELGNGVLEELAEAKKAGKAIAARLQQLNLSFNTLSELLRVRELLAATPPQQVLDTEWDTVCSILTQVWKQRQFADWQLEERTKDLSLSPDSFRLLPIDVTQFPPPPPPKLDPWRGSPDALLDWKDKLQSRIDQERQTIAALTIAVSEVEEQTLPALRDELVVAAYPPGLSSAPAGRWLGDHLGIATEYGGCHKTTRITQAIETFQIILWGVRTGTLADTYPKLKLVAPDFDEEWKWIGAYATWRAAMFVFLYPENILLPTLRRAQTPGFRQLIDELRGAGKLSPLRAREAAERCAASVRDIFTLELVATCRAVTHTQTGDRELYYLFAKGESGTIYWSVVGDFGNAEYPLRFWESVPGFAGKEATVIGADSYQIRGEQRFLYVFGRVKSNDDFELAFNRYDLRNRIWQQDISPLKPHDNAGAFEAVLRKRADEVESPTIVMKTPGGPFYERSLNKAGGDWENGDWIPRDRLWTPWTKVDPSSINAAKLSSSGRFFAAHSHDPNIVHIAVVGRDQQVYGFKWNGNLDPPKVLSDDVPKFVATLPGTGGITGVPRYAVLPNSSMFMHQLDLFTVGSDQGIYSAKWNLRDGWQTQWSRIGSSADRARANSVVSVTSRHSDIIESFIIGPNSSVYQTSWGKGTSYQWNGYRKLPDFTATHSTEVTALAVSQERGDLLSYVQGAEKLVNTTWSDAGLGPADPLLVPGFQDVFETGVVIAARRSPNAFDIFVPRKSGELWTVRRDLTTSWSKWEQVGEGSTMFSATAFVSPVVRTPTNVLAFAIDRKGVIQSNWQRDGTDESKWHRWASVVANLSPAFAPDSYIAAVVSEATPILSPVVRLFAVDVDGNLCWAECLEALPTRTVEKPASHLVWKPDLWSGASVAGLVISERLDEAQRAARTAQAKLAYATNWFATKSIVAYLEDLFYFVPVYIGLQLQKSGFYIEALDWFRLVYEYTAPMAPHELVGLSPEPANASDAYQRKIKSWLLDPLNPHAIAETRSKTYTRFTLQSIVRCLLDYADSEFTKDTAESVPRARELYELVLELLDAPDLRQKRGQCDQIIGDLSIVVNDPHWEWIASHTIQTLKSVADVSVLKKAVGKLSPILAGTAPAHEKFAALQGILSDVAGAGTETIPVGRVVEGAYAKAPLLESAVLSKTGLATAMEATLYPALSDGPEERQHRSPGAFKTMSVFAFCVPPNPVLRSLRMRADLNLYKIRNCRNIAGMQRQIEPFAAPTDASSGMPIIGGGGQLVLPGIGQLQATPYRYSLLIERAKQLVQYAVQVESAFLSALEKSDKEAFDLVSARANIRLAQAGIRLQDIRVIEAQDGIKLAELQRDRSNIQAGTYEDWIDIGQLAHEQVLLAMYDYMAMAQIMSVGLGAIMQGITGGMSIGPIYALQIAYQAANLGKGIADSFTVDIQRNINRLNVQISHELRIREWSLQKSLADQDVRIGEEQIHLANDRVCIVEQERAIEQMKADHAREVLDFLTNKFTNKELYDWMSGILERVYSFFLQQAASMAQLAADQLAFERQETAPGYIQGDYWEGSAEETSKSSSLGAKAPDRRGLTGSARLLQDIYQLDQYAFEKNQRKQQLTKSISLAQLDPLSFQRFRETGVLPFTTPMELFDRDFPGHYLRLIKRVRTTMIALIPPSQGIRATLTSSGISRVVIGGDLFQTTVVRRPPESVALSAAFNATGLFELQEQPEMLLPFEDLGVATSWEFALPKAANPFDYSTIADVLITLEYTALNSFDYKQQCVQLLNARRTTSADRAFSFRYQFADAWYDLSNPEHTATPMSVGFQTSPEDFPPNVDNIRIENVSLYIARRSGKNVEFESVDLSLEQPGGGSVGGVCRTENGLISTRLANGGGWLALRDSAPFGDWRLSLPNTEQTTLWFKDGDITDIMFVITYAGRLPEWPL